MSEHERDLAAAAALGTVSPEELARLEEEAARNPALAAQLEEDYATISMLESAVARERPPDHLLEGVLARIEDERRPASAPEPAPAPSRRRLRQLWPGFAVGFATAAAIALVFALSGDDLGPPAARAAVAGTGEFPTVTGEARIYAVDRDDGVLELELADIPAAGAGEHYEVWVLRSGSEEMEAVGVFSPTGPAVELEFRLPGPGDYAAVDVSVEPDGGPAEHSGRSLAGGKFEAGSA